MADLAVAAALTAAMMIGPRTDCAEMAGTPYRGTPPVQRLEREFYLSRCVVRPEPKPPRAPVQVVQAVSPPSQGLSGHLQRIKACESSGNYRAVDPSGTYFGAYQFDLQTWQSVGGTGNPAQASPAEQDMRAEMLYAERGPAPWPYCGRR